MHLSKWAKQHEKFVKIKYGLIGRYFVWGRRTLPYPKDTPVCIWPPASRLSVIGGNITNRWLSYSHRSSYIFHHNDPSSQCCDSKGGKRQLHLILNNIKMINVFFMILECIMIDTKNHFTVVKDNNILCHI